MLSDYTPTIELRIESHEVLHVLSIDSIFFHLISLYAPAAAVRILYDFFT